MMSDVDTFALPCTVERKRVAYLLSTAVEQGSGYWLRWVSTEIPDDAVVPAWADSIIVQADVMAPFMGGAMRFVDKESGMPVLPLDLAAVERGLALFSTVAPRHFADFISDAADAQTADVFLQLCLLGEVVYG